MQYPRRCLSGCDGPHPRVGGLTLASQLFRSRCTCSVHYSYRRNARCVLFQRFSLLSPLSLFHSHVSFTRSEKPVVCVSHLDPPWIVRAWHTYALANLHTRTRTSSPSFPSRRRCNCYLMCSLCVYACYSTLSALFFFALWRLTSRRTRLVHDANARACIWMRFFSRLDASHNFFFFFNPRSLILLCAVFLSQYRRIGIWELFDSEDIMLEVAIRLVIFHNNPGE